MNKKDKKISFMQKAKGVMESFNHYKEKIITTKKSKS